MEIQEKFKFFIVPEEQQEKLHLDGIEKSKLKPFEVTRDELKNHFERLNLAPPEQCVPAETYSMTCMCGNPPTPKLGNCTVYRGSLSGRYCYTTCESCYNVCNRP